MVIQDAVERLCHSIKRPHALLDGAFPPPALENTSPEILGKAVSQDARGITGHNSKVRNISGNNRARANHSPDPDAMAFARDDRIGAKPCVVTDLKPPKRETVFGHPAKSRVIKEWMKREALKRVVPNKDPDPAGN